LERSAHFACSSYASPGIAAHAEAARERGSVVVTEMGLDPGIDHLLAHELVRKSKVMTLNRPAVASFTSYCGSNPAVPNDFRYRFSWAPRGVLAALLTPARFIAGGVEKVVMRPWEAVTSHMVDREQFEAYPNRDSLPFIETYAFPASWKLETFVRGTLRVHGWSDAWKPVFAELTNGDEARISELAEDLAERYPATSSDHDRVVMSVRLALHTDTAETWRGEYLLDVMGNETERATSRLVSVALACAILEVVAGRVTPGLHQATNDPCAVQRWLTFLAGHGIRAEFLGDAEA
ncbi:MAG: saccharopine dehydrogenase, partial [Actinobacteria bacterium]|nr:saccharopine dehydrogenase [Actinomycetota bacterium]